MYAVIKTGGKQYKVSEGDVIKVEKLFADVEETVEINDVLAVANGEELKVGTPLVEGAKVQAKVLEHDKAKKVYVFKFKRRKKYRRKQGHRQPFTRILIEKIDA
ncbi:50S ribosomal protein L21 [Proteinivorax hydrogeniformans]|uniref:Large ribosomal subunit protein bL21 n=1 Tax=Proteinivorax hydrogeniformans TaxID=1826727 RepID=A0AAU8HWH9_9FIRM